MITKYAIFDIDGCCIDCTQRLHLIDTDYQAFVDAWKTDTPIDAGVTVYSALMRARIQGVFITARPIQQEAATKSQLAALFPGLNYRLIMSQGRLANHGTFKVRTLNSFLLKEGASKKDVVVCFDDNIDVIDAYRAEGFIAYQTAEGWK